MTPGELWDDLQSKFGLGEWNEGSGTEWWQFRVHEIVKLKAMLRRRRLSVEDVYAAAVYAHDNAIPIVAVWRLFELIPEAKRASRPQRRFAAHLLQDAIDEALALGEDQWAMRLDQVHRNDKAAIEAVLKEWENR
jgi:hypothetical protein